MILCVGEILADMIGTEKDGNVFFERKAGGAPFNVACAAKKFGASVAFVGCVGDDLIGDFLLNFAKERGLDGLYIAKNAQKNTTLAFVEIDKEGERSFCFYRKDTADYRLPEISDEALSACDIVHIGSLMLSEECGARYAENLAVRARAAGKTVSFDVNFRSDIFADITSAVAAYKRILPFADIIKFSEEETQIFTREYIEETLKDKLVCISLGSRGSEWLYGGARNIVPSIKVRPIDTTGAGDAFYAGVLTRLDGAGSFSKEVLDGALRFGNVCGALNTLGRGAIDCLPGLDDVNLALKS